jgi:hypothetical protein
MATKEQLAKHDREIAAIRTLLFTGMKMLNRNQEQINQLVASQKRTEASLQRLEKNVEILVNSLRRGSNGHSRRKVDLQ